MTAPYLAEDLLRRWRDDPLLAWNDWLPEDERPREWQPAFLEDARDAKRAALVASRNAGKSRAAAMIGLHHLVCNPGCLVLAVVPTEKQRRAAFWEEVRILWSRSTVLRGLLPGWEVFADRIDTGIPGWRMESLATDTPANLEGWHSPNTLLVVDEAQGLEDPFWDSLQGLDAARVLAVGVGGDDSGFFARSFSEDRWLWDSRTRISAHDLPRLADAFDRERKRLGDGSPIVRRMWLGEFVGSAESALFEYELLRRAIGFDPDGQDAFAASLGYPNPRIPILGVDPARGGPGGNDCAAAFMRGRSVVRIDVLPPGHELQLAANVVVTAHRYRVHAVAIDTGGLGHAVFCRVEELLAGEPITVSPYNASAKSFDDHAANLKTALVLRLRERLLNRDVGFPTGEAGERLVKELGGMSLVTEQRSGKVRVRDPRESPDFADSVLAALSIAEVPSNETVFLSGEEAHLRGLF